MKYKALRDVEYYGIKKGEVYCADEQGRFEYLIIPNQTAVMVVPLLQQDTIEEYVELPPLTKENIDDNEQYLFIKNTGVTHHIAGRTDVGDFPIFRIGEEALAKECYEVGKEAMWQWFHKKFNIK